MNVKAEAYQEWSQAAVVDKLITNMADVVRAMSRAALQGRQDHHRLHRQRRQDIGAHKLTGEMTEIAAQVPALFEALSGMKMCDLMSNVKQMAPRNTNGDAQQPLTAIRVPHPLAVSSRKGGVEPATADDSKT